MPSRTIESRKLAQAIMDQVVLEDARAWPYGCRVGMHDSVYLVREKNASTPLGWVGWQVRHENDGTRTGLYSIGLLPQFRGQGYAKEAVQKMLNHKRAEVDRVQAFIMPHNKKSLKLAERLNVPVITKLASTKVAFMTAIRRILSNPRVQKSLMAAGGAAAGGGLSEVENRTWLKDSPDSIKGVNRLSGALTGAAMPFKPLLSSTLLTGKQLATLGTGSFMQDAPNRLAASRSNAQAAGLNLDREKLMTERSGKFGPMEKILMTALGLGTAGLGIYGASAWNSRKKSRKPIHSDVIKGDPNAPRPQKVRIDLPAQSLPPEFFQSLINADDQERALMTTRTKSAAPAWLEWLNA